MAPTNSLVFIKFYHVSAVMFAVFSLFAWGLYDIQKGHYNNYQEQLKNLFTLTFLLKGKETKETVYPRGMKAGIFGDSKAVECRMYFDFYIDSNPIPRYCYIPADCFIKLEPKK